jgi:hypothetical protein
MHTDIIAAFKTFFTIFGEFPAFSGEANMSFGELPECFREYTAKSIKNHQFHVEQRLDIRMDK